MEKVVITVLGQDRPGIIAAVTRILAEQSCNIEDVSQTTLQNEFGGFFMVSLPDGLTSEDLERSLVSELKPRGLWVVLKQVQIEAGTVQKAPFAPFVVTTIGPDRIGLVAGITEVMAAFNVNITTLRAIFRGGDQPGDNVMIYEVEVPEAIDQPAFRNALRARADELGLELVLQHRDVFEAVSRI